MIRIQVEMEDLRRIESSLGMMRDKSKVVLVNAINTTAKQSMKLLVDEANKEYQIGQPARVRKTMALRRATTRKPSATIISSGRVNELYNFMVKPKTYIRGGGVPGGYKAHTKRGEAYKDIFLKQNAETGDKYRGFIIRYKNGHTTLAQRRPDRKMKSNPKKEFVKTLLAPSVPNMLGYEQGVYGAVEPQIQELLQENIQKQILRYLK